MKVLRKKIAQQEQVQDGNRTPIQITRYNLLSLKLTVLEKRPKWFQILISQSFRVWECHEEEKRWSIDACLNFCHVFSLPSLFVFTTQFSFSSLILNFSLITFSLCSSSLSVVPSQLPLIHFIPLNSMGFLPFIPRASPTVFGSLWASLQACPLTHQLPSHYLYSDCACCTTLHS